MAQVTTCDQHSLADSSINYMAMSYQTCVAHRVLSTLRPSGSHSCECTTLQHNGMTGRLCT